jgi:anti-anti-sigma factor
MPDDLTSPAPFSATSEETAPGVFALRVAGEIDLSTRPTLDAELARLAEKEPDVVVVDLTEVTFCASTGLAALVELNSRCLAENRELRIAASPALRRIVELSGLANVLPLTGGA